jgi:hypothetical protein
MRAHDAGMLVANSCGEVVNVMSKSATSKYCDQQITDNLEQMLTRVRESLREPLKLTVTSKRRALKGKAAGKIGGPGPEQGR